jgi:hypothetical protein
MLCTMPTHATKLYEWGTRQSDFGLGSGGLRSDFRNWGIGCKIWVAGDFVPSYQVGAVSAPAIDGRDEWARAHFLFALKVGGLAL